PSTGGLVMGKARVLEGRAHVTLPAPLDEVPLLVRRGATIPLLPPDVWSLAAPREESSLHLLAFPGGKTITRLERHRRLTSVETRTGWSLRVEPEHRVEIDLQASLDFEPSSVEISDGRLEEWTYDAPTRVLRAAYSGRSPVLLAKR
ncbi:MAG: hypothetical protein M3R21_09875, partial [Candidatus Dormibacteraeota bacterium]|nr:hypothetical protein [Candidatus Dormibacteraeota bacterium]